MAKETVYVGVNSKMIVTPKESILEFPTLSLIYDFIANSTNSSIFQSEYLFISYLRLVYDGEEENTAKSIFEEFADNISDTASFDDDEQEEMFNKFTNEEFAEILYKNFDTLYATWKKSNK